MLKYHLKIDTWSLHSFFTYEASDKKGNLKEKKQNTVFSLRIKFRKDTIWNPRKISKK